MASGLLASIVLLTDCASCTFRPSWPHTKQDNHEKNFRQRCCIFLFGFKFLLSKRFYCKGVFQNRNLEGLGHLLMPFQTNESPRALLSPLSSFKFDRGLVEAAWRRSNCPWQAALQRLCHSPTKQSLDSR